MEDISVYNISNDFSSGDLYIYEDDKTNGYIANIFVEESERRKGFGGKLMIELEKLAESKDISNIELRVDSKSFMCEWYKKLGYEYLADDEDEEFIWLKKELKCKK